MEIYITAGSGLLGVVITAAVTWLIASRTHRDVAKKERQDQASFILSSWNDLTTQLSARLTHVTEQLEECLDDLQRCRDDSG